MAENERVHARRVELLYCGFYRQGEGWARGARLITDASLAAMDEDTWVALLTRLRQSLD